LRNPNPNSNPNLKLNPKLNPNPNPQRSRKEYNIDNTWAPPVECNENTNPTGAAFRPGRVGFYCGGPGRGRLLG